MSDYEYLPLELDDNPPFVGDSVLYSEPEERFYRNGFVIDGSMTQQQVAQVLAKAFPNDYRLMEIITEIGRVKL